MVGQENLPKMEIYTAGRSYPAIRVVLFDK